MENKELYPLRGEYRIIGDYFVDVQPKPEGYRGNTKDIKLEGALICVGSDLFKHEYTLYFLTPGEKSLFTLTLTEREAPEVLLDVFRYTKKALIPTLH